MRLSYDPNDDVLYIRLKSGPIKLSEELEPGVDVYLDEEGHVVGLEIRHARRRLSLEDLTSVSYENLALKRRSSLNLP